MHSVLATIKHLVRCVGSKRGRKGAFSFNALRRDGERGGRERERVKERGKR